uniref:glyoxalase superfamily protein n=1 Tax=Pararhizobium sp. IMCC3301 TaxID=3067904 RepID=UPI0027408C78|nr:glyoxalase superfamily protein [Pararhizobium sp. IMCC3301]
MSQPLPTAAEAKASAKRLRTQLAEHGTKIGHANALELVAHAYSFRDWNTFHAAIKNHPPDGWTPGGRVQGSYLSQPFTASVVGAEMRRPGWFCLTLDLDEAVDVVTFDSFSNFRKRIRGIVGPNGTSRERTSDSLPHLKIDICLVTEVFSSRSICDGIRGR